MGASCSRAPPPSRPRWTSVLWDIENVPVRADQSAFAVVRALEAGSQRELWGVGGEDHIRFYNPSVPARATHPHKVRLDAQASSRSSPARRAGRDRKIAARLMEDDAARPEGRDLCHRLERHRLLRGCEAVAQRRRVLILHDAPAASTHAETLHTRRRPSLGRRDWRERRSRRRRTGHGHVRGGAADRAQEATSRRPPARGARRGRRRRRLAGRERRRLAGRRIARVARGRRPRPSSRERATRRVLPLEPRSRLGAAHLHPRRRPRVPHFVHRSERVGAGEALEKGEAARLRSIGTSGRVRAVDVAARDGRVLGRVAA